MKVGSWQHWWQRQWLKQPFIAVYKWWLCSLWTYHNMNTLKLSHVQCFVCVCMWVHGHTTICCVPISELRSTSVSMQLEYSVMNMWGTHATYCACERRGQAMLECQRLCSYARAMGFRVLDQQWGSGKASYLCVWYVHESQRTKAVLHGNMFSMATCTCEVFMLHTVHHYNTCSSLILKMEVQHLYQYVTFTFRQGINHMASLHRHVKGLD